MYICTAGFIQALNLLKSPRNFNMEHFCSWKVLNNSKLSRIILENDPKQATLPHPQLPNQEKKIFSLQDIAGFF